MLDLYYLLNKPILGPIRQSTVDFIPDRTSNPGVGSIAPVEQLLYKLSLMHFVTIRRVDA